MNPLLPRVIAIAKQAGEQILAIYHSGFVVKLKADQSPLTTADLAAHHCIYQGLQHLTPDLPILSEESGLASFEERQRWQRYWLLDPLDGTKEFLEKNGEFTINIALIDRHRPVLGVIFVPSLATCYFAEYKQGAFKQVMEHSPQPLHTRTWQNDTSATITISRKHHSVVLQDFLMQFSKYDLLPCGSALKFCWVAEGTVDIYPRFSPTFEWDTAAGQCILEEAGGIIIDDKGQTLRYNETASLCNTVFLAVGDRVHPWSNYINRQMRFI